MIHLLMSHPGTHAVAHAAPVAALPMIFRRAIAAARRKPPVPEVQTTASGAGADWGDAAPRPYDERSCGVPSAHGMTAPYWCTVPAHHSDWNDVTAPSGFPVLRDRMLSGVRNEWEQGLVPAQASAHADAVHEMSARYLPAAPDLAATYRRPVNGRRLPDQPRRRPVFGEAPVASVLGAERDAARAAGERFRATYEPASPRLLDQVLAGLRRL